MAAAAPVRPRELLGTPPGCSRPRFVRETLLKLCADTDRGSHSLQLPDITPPAGDRAPSTLSSLPRAPPARPAPRPEPPVEAPGPCESRKIGLTHDLERCRAALADDLRAQLRAVQDTLRDADVAGLGQQFAEELGVLREREVQAQQECQQLRDHCEHLLQLNAQLRQNQLDVVLSGFQKQMEELSNNFKQAGEAHEAQRRQGSEMETHLSGLHAALGPLHDVRGALEGFLGKVEERLVQEVRAVLTKELQPFRAEQLRMHEKVTQVSDRILKTNAHLDHFERSHADVMSTVRSISEQAAANKQTALENREMMLKNRERVEENKQLIERNKQGIDNNLAHIRKQQRNLEDQKADLDHHLAELEARVEAEGRQSDARLEAIREHMQLAGNQSIEYRARLEADLAQEMRSREEAASRTDRLRKQNRARHAELMRQLAEGSAELTRQLSRQMAPAQDPAPADALDDDAEAQEAAARRIQAIQRGKQGRRAFEDKRREMEDHRQS